MPIDAANPVPPTYPRLVGMDQVPAHVPQDLIRSVGITYSPEFLADPHGFIAALLEKQPLMFYHVGLCRNSCDSDTSQQCR